MINSSFIPLNSSQTGAAVVVEGVVIADVVIEGVETGVVVTSIINNIKCVDLKEIAKLKNDQPIEHP
jgi:molybdopterin-binding protein